MDAERGRKGVSRSPDRGVPHLETGERRIHHRAERCAVRQRWPRHRLRCRRSTELKRDWRSDTFTGAERRIASARSASLRGRAMQRPRRVGSDPSDETVNGLPVAAHDSPRKLLKLHRRFEHRKILAKRRALLLAFLKAASVGDVRDLKRLLADDAVLIADGGPVSPQGTSAVTQGARAGAIPRTAGRSARRRAGATGGPVVGRPRCSSAGLDWEEEKPYRGECRCRERLRKGPPTR